MFEGVRKLPAGSRLVCENGKLGEPERYFELRFDHTRSGSFRDLTRVARPSRTTVGPGAGC